MNELEYQVTKAVAQCMTRAGNYFQCTFPHPQVLFNQRGKSAGTARLQTWQLRFNPVLLSENPQAFLNEVVPHEVSHLVVYERFGRVRPHGKEWQAVMSQVFGVTPKTTHSFDVSSVQGKTFTYQCGCDEIPLSVRRHNKVQREQVKYVCRRCKQPLVYRPTP
ncbi:SprT family zinc-dependent metalloprotease [Enterovibrio sp. NIFS-20-8]|nr:SprT family zinc-dependent metalloprotease [Enterovibrio paralichthyis]MBV7297821.1 SprT family zinc-dependent metalloprotease [Enterovibrio paralichthyis]